MPVHQAYFEGQNARNDKIPHKENPYPVATREARMWSCGWVETCQTDVSELLLPERPSEIKILRAAVNGVYDLQNMRMASGLRLVANFRAKLDLLKRSSEPDEGEEQDSNDDEEEAARKKKESEAKKIIKQLKASYRRLTDGIAAKHKAEIEAAKMMAKATEGTSDEIIGDVFVDKIPRRDEFIGDAIISNHAELVLVHLYLDLERNEAKQFRMLTTLLENIPIYNEWLYHQDGIGPAMAGVLIAYFDPFRARHVSSFWKYAGLDVGSDGMGRSRRAEHLVQRAYKTKTGEIKYRSSLTYEPFAKTKVMGVLAGSFMLANKGKGAEPWRAIYDGYKHRLMTDPGRERVTLAEWKSRHKAGDDVKTLWPPGRINNASKRFMAKQFLQEFWIRWRAIEELPVTEPYAVAKLRRPPHGGVAGA
jgi:hypothetical protein